MGYLPAGLFTLHMKQGLYVLLLLNVLACLLLLFAKLGFFLDGEDPAIIDPDSSFALIHEDETDSRLAGPSEQVRTDDLKSPALASFQAPDETGDESDELHEPSRTPLVREAEAKPELIDSLDSFIDSLRRLDSDNLEQVVASWEAMPNGQDRSIHLRLLMQAWGKQDPQAALSYARELKRRGEQLIAIKDVVSIWTRNSPDDALAWISENVEKREADRYYLPAAIAGIAAQDPNRANQLMFSNPNLFVQTALANHHIEQGMAGAMEWASSLPSNKYASAVGRVAREAVIRNPEKCAKWIEQLQPGTTRNLAISSTISAMTGNNPSGATNLVSTFDDPSLRAHAMKAVVNRWTVRDPIVTAQWLNEQPHEVSDEVVQTFALRVSYRDPESSVIWANSIKDETLRDRTVSASLNRWIRKDLSSAKAWRAIHAPHLSTLSQSFSE